MLRTLLNTLKVSDLEEAGDQDTHSDAVDCGKSFCVLYFKNV